ncbi:hypothetical protein [Paraburkholderia xenovorans]|uniref:hypothetical protein n=1 Tax=Paraburkholderia xenovorans TaxID=36873 RepID=UPI0038BA6FCE
MNWRGVCQNLDRVNGEIVRKAMPVSRARFTRSVSNGFHCNVDEHCEQGRRFMLHGLATWFHFHGGRRLG